MYSPNMVYMRRHLLGEVGSPFRWIHASNRLLHPSPVSRQSSFRQTVSAMGLGGLVALAACALLVAADTTTSNAASLVVDVGYGVYNGVYNSTTQLNVWKG